MAVRHDAKPTALTAARRREASKRGLQSSGRGSGLTPRIKQAIEHLVFGVDGEPGAIVRMQDAAESVGLTCRALRAAMLKPAVEAHYNRQMAAMRNGERAASIRKMVAIRDDAGAMKTPAGMKVVLDASKALAFDTPASTISVNVGVGLTVGGEKPGYVIDLSSFPAEEHPTLPAAQPVQEPPHA
jgi:hypothetical protein